MFDVDLEVEVRKAVGASVPGIVVVVVGREGVRARAAVGLADVSSRTQMRIDDGFLWFSMTKIATATTALRLVERRALDLDAPLASLLPVVRLLKPGWVGVADHGSASAPAQRGFREPNPDQVDSRNRPAGPRR